MTRLCIPIPIWDTRIYFIFWPKDAAREMYRVGVTKKDVAEVMETDCRAITFENEKEEPVILLKTKEPYHELIGTLTHEVFHAVHALLSQRDVKLREGDANESHAYLLGYVMERVVRRLK